MSNDLTMFQGANLPAAFQPLMQQMQSSELSDNVGTRYGVVSIKGKVFRIKFDGVETPLTIQHNGSTFAAPYFDVIIPMANGALSKTWYTSGYSEGSDESPTCWSEDGINPLAPIAQRPKLADGSPCSDCRVCPMNMFGSKVNAETGSKGKACADTRKLAVLPVDGQGQIDFENQKFGGVMLMRVPAASLQPLAEMDRRLQGMGIPYFAVVVRLSFDQSVAYPKLSFTPVRMVNDAEARQILELRNSPAVLHLLGADQTAAPSAAQLPAPSAPPVAPPSNVTPITAAAPSPAVPVPPQAPEMPPQAPVAPPAPEMPPQAPAPAPVAPPAPEMPPQAPAPAPVPQQAPAAFTPPPVTQDIPQAPAAAFQPPQQAVQAAPAPAPAPAAPAAAQAPQAPQVDPGLLSRVDQLLGT